MRTIITLSDLYSARHSLTGKVGLVPTMGYLHEGHLSLVRRAKEECDQVAVSIFVNPAQFEDPADLERYPRDERADASAAERAGIQAIILTENYLTRFEYGLLPFRRVLRRAEGVPSLTPGTLPAYLAAVREAQARHPGVLLVPGLEVLPHYHWSGSLWNGTLTLHNSQKNLLVVGLDLPALRRLPVAGNTEGVPIHWGASASAVLGAVVLAVAGVHLAGSRRRRRVRLRHLTVLETRPRRLPGLALIALAALVLLNYFPTRAVPFTSYRDAGTAPQQALIRSVAQDGGLVFWSFPEARDFHVLTRGPFRITLRTEPYPGDLLATDGYTGFRGIYEDTTTFTDPGGGWDRRLQEFALQT